MCLKRADIPNVRDCGASHSPVPTTHTLTDVAADTATVAQGEESDVMETPTDPSVKEAQAHLPELSPSSSYEVISGCLVSLVIIASVAFTPGTSTTLVS